MLRALCVAVLMSFTLPVYAGISTADYMDANNNLAGAGTLQDPWQISNCIDLASLGQYRYQSDEVSAKSFVLTSDIDCSDTINWNDGMGFLPLPQTLMYTPWGGEGQPPEQYFDGNGKTITGLYTNIASSQGLNNTAQLFQIVGFGATIKNLNVTSANFTEQLSGPYYHAILAAQNYGVIQNSRVQGAMYISGNGGMLVGENMGEISQSSASGTLNARNTNGGSFGGLAGISMGISQDFGIVSSQISNSYSEVAISSTSTSSNLSCGGLLGSTSEIPQDWGFADGPMVIKNSYSTGMVWCNQSSTSTMGGLVGRFDLANFDISDSFSTSWVINGGSDAAGAIVGSNALNKTFENTYYDATSATLLVCSPAPNQNACQSENVDGNDGNYFLNNSTNAPLDSWDFNNLWYVTSQFPHFLSGMITPGMVGGLSGVANLDSIDLSWNPPTLPIGGVFADYQIFYREAGTQNWISFQDGISSNTFITITGLNSSTDYEIRIRAQNAAGYGLYNLPITVRTTSAPGTTGISYRGDGSVDNPIQISKCTQLQDLSLPQYEYNLDSPLNYILTNDIDCSDSENWNFGGGFAMIRAQSFSSESALGIAPLHPQYFDGRNYTISNLKLRDSSMFEAIGSQTTIKNVKLSNVSFENWMVAYPNIGGLAGMNNGTIENAHVDFSVTRVYLENSSIGGITGSNFGLINRSSSSGSITLNDGDSGNIGGIAGLSVYGTIDNSYSNLGILESGNAHRNNCGGLIGKMVSSSIDHSYSSNSIYCAKQDSASGTLVGDANNTNSPGISNSFGTGLVGNLAGSFHGAVVGKAHSNAYYPNTFFDAQGTQQLSCTNLNSNACTAKNVFWQDAYYFNNNSTNAPLNSWDFGSIWNTTSYYPILRDAIISPDRPNNLIGIPSLTSASLSWEAPNYNGGATITDYEIQYKKSSDDTWTVFDDGISSDTSTTITNLEQGALYNYRVRARNSAGYGIYSFARTELQLQAKIQSPVATEFVKGQSIDYSISLVNTTLSPIDSIGTTFLTNAFAIDSITPAIGVVGGAPTNIGSVTNNDEWNGLLEPNQELVFHVSGTVTAMPNEVGKLSFSGASISYQGTALDLGADSDGTVRAESTSFIVKETATDFSISTSIRETGVIDQGDSVHLKYAVENNGPNIGYYYNSSVSIIIPTLLSITEIQTSNFTCTLPVLIGDNLNGGIFADLQGQYLVQCYGKSGSFTYEGDIYTIDITSVASRNLNAGDILSQSMFITSQDVGTVALASALGGSAISADTIFASENNNASRYTYNVVRPPSQIPTPTTTPKSGSSTTTTPNTPSSKDSITTNKAGSATGKVLLINKTQGSSSSSSSTVSPKEASNAYEGLPEIKTFLQDTNKAVKASEKKSLAASFKAKGDSPLELFWLAGGLIISLAAIGLRQTISIRKATKKLRN